MNNVNEGFGWRKEPIEEKPPEEILKVNLLGQESDLLRAKADVRAAEALLAQARDRVCSIASRISDLQAALRKISKC